MSSFLRSGALLAFLVVSLNGCVALRLWPDNETGISIPSPMPEGMSDSLFIAQSVTILQDIRHYEEGLTRLLREAQARPELFRPPQASALFPDQKQELRLVYRSFLDYQLALEQIRLRYCSHWKINPVKHRKAQAVSFYVFNSAFLAQNKSGSEFIRQVNNEPQIERFLNEAESEAAPSSYDRLKFRVLNLITFQMVAGNQDYLNEMARPALKDDPEALLIWADAYQESCADSLLAQARERNLPLAVMNAKDIARRQVFDLIFPAQKSLAEYMGDTRYGVSRHALIAPVQIDSLKDRLEPGDILLIRHNWYLSNIGLPGFWPHAALYIGSPEEAANYFQSDSGVKAALLSLSGNQTNDFAEYVRQIQPENYARWQAGDSVPVRILEALSEGVVFNSLKNTCDADYVSVLRPRLSKKDKALSILQAMAYRGIPYDFDFDFSTDRALVCTELVYKAYQPRASMDKGLEIPLIKVLGRFTLPPNDIAALFARELGMPAARFNFVAFLDGSEKQRNASFKDEAAFSKTHTRPKWDFAQE